VAAVVELHYAASVELAPELAPCLLQSAEQSVALPLAVLRGVALALLQACLHAAWGRCPLACPAPYLV
jgi:hypothetical protein